MFHQSNEAKESVLTQCRCVHRGGWFWVQSLNCWSYLACGHEEGEDEDKGALGHWQPVGLLHGEEDGTVEAGFGWAVERKKKQKKTQTGGKTNAGSKNREQKGLEWRLAQSLLFNLNSTLIWHCKWVLSAVTLFHEGSPQQIGAHFWFGTGFTPWLHFHSGLGKSLGLHYLVTPKSQFVSKVGGISHVKQTGYPLTMEPWCLECPF